MPVFELVQQEKKRTKGTPQKHPGKCHTTLHQKPNIEKHKTHSFGKKGTSGGQTGSFGLKPDLTLSSLKKTERPKFFIGKNGAG